MPQSCRPLCLSLFGDWLLEAPDGSIHLLDTLEGQIARLAATSDLFRQAIEDEEEKRDEWLLEGHVLGQADRGVVLRSGQCFGFKVPPILGAPIEAGNIQPCDIVSYEIWIGQLHERIKALPPGTSINEIKVDGH